MFKRNTIAVSILSASALVTICLFASVITAQKGPSTTTGAPVGGCDIKLGKNPGGSAAARTATADEHGVVNWGRLDPGHYTLTIMPASDKQRAAHRASGIADSDNYLVTITGAVGGPIAMVWDPRKNKAYKSMPVGNLQGQIQGTAKGTPPQEYNSIDFEIPPGPPTPCQTAILKSKSNIASN